MPVIQQPRASALRARRVSPAPLGALAAALVAWLAALILATWPAPLRLDAPGLAVRGYDLYDAEPIAGRLAIFTRERPEIPLPRRAAGGGLVELQLRAPGQIQRREVLVRLGSAPPVAISATSDWRRFRMLIAGDPPLTEASSLVLQTEASHFPHDDRRLGLVLSLVAVTPARSGPAWPGALDALLLALALLLGALLPVQLGARPLAGVGLSGAVLLLLTPLLGESRGSTAIYLLGLAGLHAALALVRWPGRQRWPALARRAAPLGAVLAAVLLGAALAAPGGVALTLQLVAAVGAVVLVLCYAGFGLAWFLRTPRLAPALPLLAPALGMAGLTIAGHALGGLPVGTDRTAWPLLALFSAINAVAWRRGARPALSRAHAPALAAALLALVLALLPLYQIGRLTTMGATIDAISYLARAEQIRATGLLVEPPAGLSNPVAQSVSWQIDQGMRQGDTFVLGFFSSLLGVRPHLLFPVLMAVWHALAAVGVYVLAAYALGLGRWAAFAAGALTAVNALLHWALMDDFLSQVAGTSLWCVTLAAVVVAWRSSLRGVALAGVLAGALASFYHVFLLYLAVPAALAALYELWRARRRLWPAIARIAARAAAIGALAVAVVPAGWWLLWRQLHLLGGLVRRDGIAPGAQGNILIYPHLSEVLGLVSHPQAAYDLPLPQLPAPAATALGLVFAALALLGVAQARGRARWLLGALVLTFAAALAQQRFWYDMGRGFPYGYYKVISLAAPVAMLLVAAGAAAAIRAAQRLSPPWRAGAQAATVWLVAGMACISIVHLVAADAFVNRSWLQADGATLEVEQAARMVPAGEPLLIIDDRHPGRSWLIYLVRRPDLYARDPNPGWLMAPAEQSPRPIRYALLAEPDQPRVARPGEPWFDPAAHVVLWRNQHYALLRRTGG